MALHVALIEPQIPPNTGNVARLCAATDSSLHLIGQLGFSLADKDLRRAGLDYWDSVDLWHHPEWRAFRDAISRERLVPVVGQRLRMRMPSDSQVIVIERRDAAK